MLAAAIIISAQQIDFPELTGPYLAQKLQVMKSEIYAGIPLSSEVMGSIIAFKLDEKYGCAADTIVVPIGNGNPVLIDGIFSPGEWTDALRIKITDSLEIFLKHYQGHAYIGIYCPLFISKIADVFISTDNKVIYQLHSSAQLGERHRTIENPNPEVRWGDTKGWYANETRWDAKKLSSLVNDGKSRDEAILEAIYPYDGFEYQILLNKFNSTHWFIRFWIAHDTLPTSREYIYPPGTKELDTTSWMILEFNR